MEADIYTLAYNPNATLPYFATKQIRTTWLNTFVRSMRGFRWSFPIATYVMESIDFGDYDIVLSSSATVGKYIRVPNGVHICYCYIPTRALWQKEKYFDGSILKYLVAPFVKYLKKRDLAAASRVDKFIAISEDSQMHILKTYGTNSEVINSPIDCSKFKFSEKKSEHFLLVSRLEKWKRIDFAIEAFNQLGLPLRIVGTGEESTYLQSLAKPNIHFCGRLDDDDLAKEYSAARAVIFTPELEYGLIPLEASASGTPVIALGRAGVLETMQPYSVLKEKTREYTAVFFPEQTAQSLIAAVNTFESIKFDHQYLYDYARKWDVPMFKAKIRRTISEHMR